MLAKAMETFWRLGYEATTMADLRGALGITQASLYAAFGKKELLFREAVDLYLRTAGTTTVRRWRINRPPANRFAPCFTTRPDLLPLPDSPRDV